MSNRLGQNKGFKFAENEDKLKEVVFIGFMSSNRTLFTKIGGI